MIRKKGMSPLKKPKRTHPVTPKDSPRSEQPSKETETNSPPTPVEPSHDEVPSTSASIPVAEECEEGFDFVFKRPRTPPPKLLKKETLNRMTSRRIRSKSKPGKTGFPIGASLHGLSKLEKQERRNRVKSRSGVSGSSEESILPDVESNESPENPGSSNIDTSYIQSGFGGENIISHPRQALTKLKFPTPSRGRESSHHEKSSKKSHHSPDHGVKESIEICQGLSKIKLDDWQPFFDFHKNSEPKESETSSSNVAENGEPPATVDDDEWEETLVYVDLEDIPDVDALFASLGSRQEEGEDSDGHQREIQIFNLESDLPVLLLGGKHLAGHWEDTCGTSMFFKKKEQYEGDREGEPFLKNILPEPEIPFDPIFGQNHSNQGDDDYELVAKSMKVLKARYFPVVNDELKGEDVIRDPDDEFDQRDFQIPPIHMVHEFIPNCAKYESFLLEDVDRRRKIQEKWGRKRQLPSTLPESELDTNNIVKTEPIEFNYGSDTDDLDSILILGGDSIEPLAGPSNQ